MYLGVIACHVVAKYPILNLNVIDFFKNLHIASAMDTMFKRKEMVLKRLVIC